MDRRVIALIWLLACSAAMLWLLSLAKPSSPGAWLNLGAILLLPSILAAALVLGLDGRLSSARLNALAFAPSAIGLAIAASPLIGRPDAQGGLALLLAPVVQLAALGVTTFVVTRRR